MPLRFHTLFPTIRLARRFHNSAVQRISNGKNYYEILQIPTTASPAEVKKSFYSLSKLHHPDHNPDDPQAAKRFVEISEAYSTLRIPAKKQAYDREHIHAPHVQGSNTAWRPAGSYSSHQAYNGSRPASGLSRRKTQFRGPPPSFYRSGGWGEHSAKRKEAQSKGAPAAEKPEFGDNLGGGMGFGDTPFGKGWENDVPHFDRDGHYRTHLNQDRRRRRRSVPGNGSSGVESGGVLANFVIVCTVLGFVTFAPAMAYSQVGQKKDKHA